jgi:hypothetical protein
MTKKHTLFELHFWDEVCTESEAKPKFAPALVGQSQDLEADTQDFSCRSGSAPSAHRTAVPQTTSRSAPSARWTSVPKTVPPHNMPCQLTRWQHNMPLTRWQHNTAHNAPNAPISLFQTTQHGFRVSTTWHFNHVALIQQTSTHR